MSIATRRELSETVWDGTVAPPPPMGVRSNSKHIALLWRLKYRAYACCSQVWSFITSKWLKVEAYYLRGGFCPWKELSKNVWHGAVAPKGHPQMTNMLRFGDIFSCIPISRSSTPSPVSSHSLYSPASHFTPPLPFPMEVNEKLRYHSLDWLDGRIMFSICPSVRLSVCLSVSSFVCYQLTNAICSKRINRFKRRLP